MRRLLHAMLKKSARDRAALSDILQDREMREALENPLDGEAGTAMRIYNNYYNTLHDCVRCKV